MKLLYALTLMVATNVAADLDMLEMASCAAVSDFRLT